MTYSKYEQAMLIKILNTPSEKYSSAEKLEIAMALLELGLLREPPLYQRVINFIKRIFRT